VETAAWKGDQDVGIEEKCGGSVAAPEDSCFASDSQSDSNGQDGTGTHRSEQSRLPVDPLAPSEAIASEQWSW
jgi:hypothetical protein